MKRLDVRPDVAHAQDAARHITLTGALRPTLGMILGTGWASVADSLKQPVKTDYQSIPHFPRPRVQGHPGCLAVGELSGRRVAVLAGRSHLYEGYTMAEVAFPVLVLRELGVTDLIVTNAAGGLNPELAPGDLMVINDHINLPGLVGDSPLTGLPGAFLDMAGAYEPSLVQLARDVSGSVGHRAAQGVYAMVGGPTYETRAEANLLRVLGADAVGMSTIPEVVAARWSGMRVLGLSLITNAALHAGTGLTHDQVLRKVEEQAPRLRSIIEKLVGEWPR